MMGETEANLSGRNFRRLKVITTPEKKLKERHKRKEEEKLLMAVNLLSFVFCKRCLKIFFDSLDIAFNDIISGFLFAFFQAKISLSPAPHNNNVINNVEAEISAFSAPRFSHKTHK
jgi:hypothetical protein